MLVLLDAGYELIPLHAPGTLSANGRELGKAPMGRNWRTAPALNRETLAEHVASGCNVGNRLRACDLVVDIDPRNFDGSDSDADLENRFDFSLLEYPQIITGSRPQPGAYALMRLLEEVAERIATGELRLRHTLDGFPGIEFKTLGRQVVAPGSVHPDSKELYEWDPDVQRDGLADVPLAPPLLVEALIKPARTYTTPREFTHHQVQAALDSVDVMRFNGKHEEWLEFMMATHSASNGEALAEFVAWSTADPEYAHIGSSIAHRWESLEANRQDGVTAASFQFLVDRHGGRVPMDPDEFAGVDDDEDAACLGLVPLGRLGEAEVRTSVQRSGKETDTYQTGVALVLHELNESLMPRRNQMTGEIEFRGGWVPWEHLPALADARALNDRTLGLLRLYILEVRGIELSKANLADALEQAADLASYHPVREYLAGLEWDGVDRVDRFLGDYLGAEDGKLTKATSRLMLVAAVRRALRAGCKFDVMPVLVGRQGTGKSSALKNLCPDPNWFSDETLDLGHNPEKAGMHLQGTWVHEVAELAGITNARAKLENLRAFMSRDTDRFRRPYDRFPTVSPREFVMVGTTNSGSFLTDITGNRRFAPVRTGAVDLAAIERDRDQLWAEAVCLESVHGPLHLPPELWERAAESAAEFSHDHPYFERL